MIVTWLGLSLSSFSAVKPRLALSWLYCHHPPLLAGSSLMAHAVGGMRIQGQMQSMRACTKFGCVRFTSAVFGAARLARSGADLHVIFARNNSYLSAAGGRKV
jgi:predicted NBD/HSP70 family sugar kinase